MPNPIIPVGDLCKNPCDCTVTGGGITLPCECFLLLANVTVIGGNCLAGVTLPVGGAGGHWSASGTQDCGIDAGDGGPWNRDGFGVSLYCPALAGPLTPSQVTSNGITLDSEGGEGSAERCIYRLQSFAIVSFRCDPLELVISATYVIDAGGNPGVCDGNPWGSGTFTLTLVFTE